MATLLHDLRYALRALRRRPGFTLAAVLTLGLGIGINAVAFGAIDALLLRPPAGVGDPDGLFRVQLRPKPRPGMPPVWGGAGVPYPYFLELRERSGAFSSLAAYVPGRKVTFESGGVGERLDASLVSTDYFTTLRVRPALGHLFTPGDDRAAGYLAVLSYDSWLRRFGGDPAVVGRTLRLNGHPTRVVGVAPPRFRGLDLSPVDVWLTIATAGASAMFGPDIEWLQLVGRPRPGLTPAQAAAHVMAVAPPDFLTRRGVTGMRATLVSARQRYAPGQSPVPPWILAVTGVVLLVACANVAGLLLARASRRRRELAVRLALGASRGRIARQLLTETGVLAVGGAGLGLLLASWGGALLPLVGAPPLDTLLDLRAAAFTGGTMLFATLVAGLAPALRASRTDVEAELKMTGGRIIADRSRLRSALTIGQVALALALLVCAGLFARSLRNARAIRVGYDTEHAVVVHPLFARGSMSPGKRTAFYQAAVARLRHLTGVVAAERVSMAPNQGMGFSDVDFPGGEQHQTVISTLVGPDYFRAMGTALVEGRAFTSADGQSSPPVAIVTPAFARKYFPGREPLGACFVVVPAFACTRIVGVVGDTKLSGILRDAPPQFYLPLTQRPDAEPDVSIVLRTRGDPELLIAALRREVQGLDRRVVYVAVSPERRLLSRQFDSWRTATRIVSFAALLTLVLALIGLYGIVSYLAAERTQEVGIRMALGARQQEIRALVLREGARLALAGTTIGILVAFAAARLLRSRLFGVSPTDPAIYLAAALALAVAAIAASYFPARRAARVDPTEALRAE